MGVKRTNREEDSENIPNLLGIELQGKESLIRFRKFIMLNRSIWPLLVLLEMNMILRMIRRIVYFLRGMLEVR